MPPPHVEAPFKYKGYQRREPKGRKLTDEQVIELRRTRGDGKTYAALAAELDVSLPTVWNAMKGITFRHLNIDHPPLL